MTSEQKPSQFPTCEIHGVTACQRNAMQNEIDRLSAMHRDLAARLGMRAWCGMDIAPRDGTWCLFYSPGHKGLDIPVRWRVDQFSDDWPDGHHQLPTAPYTHWQRLPEVPS